MPDQFGNQTPQEVIAELAARRQQINPPGQGNVFQQAAGNFERIFGAAAQQYRPEVIRAGRIQEALRQGGARGAARAAMLPEGADELDREIIRRKAQFDAISDIDPATASKLADQIIALRVQKQELSRLQAQERRAESAEDRANLQLLTEDDTFILMDDRGVVKDMKSVSDLDVATREELREAGYIRAGSSFAFQLTKESLDSRKVPSQDSMEDVASGLSMMAGFRVLRGVKDQTGILEGPIRGVAARFGLGDRGFIDAVAVKDKMRADIQSLIKGIPSNYDASVFEITVPDPTAFQSTELYQARLDLAERETKRLVELVAAFHKGTDKEFPEPVLQAMAYYGITPDRISGIGEEEFRRATEEHQRLMEQQAKVFSQPGAPGSTTTQSTRKVEVIRIN